MKTLPGLHELIAGDLDLAGQIRPVQVEDLLGREPVEVDLDAIASYVAGKTVLVTGAGGSIGSEPVASSPAPSRSGSCSSTRRKAPSTTSSASFVDERRFVACVPVLADVRNRKRLHQVFERYRRTSSSTRPRTSTCR